MEKSSISNQELDILLESHRKYLLGESDGILLELENRIIEGYDFSGKDCENAQFLSCSFIYEFEGEEVYDNSSGESYYMKPNGTRFFSYTNFTNVNFTGCTFGGIFDFDTARLNNAIFINVDWNKLQLNLSQKAVIITTVSQLTNKIKIQDEVIEDKDQKIEVKNSQLEKTSEKEAKDMLSIFEELRKDFSFEERLWLIFAFYVFLILFSIASFLVARVSVFMAAYANIVLLAIVFMIVFIITPNTKEKDEKPEYGLGALSIAVTFSTFAPVTYFSHEAYMMWLKKPSEWVNIIGGILNFESLEHIFPISLILLSMLWFSIHQYGRAKKLRIEQQNKQAMIHFMQAIIANDGKGSPADRSFPQLAPFFANAVIHRPFSQENYDPQLPIDEVKKVIDMAKLFQK